MLYNVRMNITCADPGIFVRGGVQVNLTKKSSDNVFFFFFFFFFFLSSAYSSEVKWVNFSKKTIIFQGSRGVQLFPGGGGSNCLFPIETHITCDFPGGSGPPVPPLDPHLYNNNLSNLSSIKKNSFYLILKKSLLTEFEKKKKESKDSQKGNDFLG